MNPIFENLVSVISHRRTQKANRMNGKPIQKEWIEQLLQLADYAPTHGRTEPWRFDVFEGVRLQQFCTDHAELYWKHTNQEKRTEHKYEQLKNCYNGASYLLVVHMKRSIDSKIPEKEEYAACCAAIQNILLGAEALGLASIWSTGGMAYSTQMKDYLHLNEEDQVVGFVYLGFSDYEKGGAVRKIALDEKIKWG